jgi:hypothetical protein
MVPMSASFGPFSSFRTAVAAHFAPVAAEFGLDRRTEREFATETQVTFSDEERRLAVSFEVGGVPWVGVCVSDRGRDQEFLLQTLERDVEGTCDSTNAVAGMQTVDEQIRTLAILTRRYAAGLLRGDFGRVRSLKRLRAEARRRRNLEMFGTPSRARPLEHRPTLAELFVEAGKAQFPADARMFAIYQAVWDHGYSIEDVAHFTRLVPGDIERILDTLDNVGDDPPDLDALRKLVGGN